MPAARNSPPRTIGRAAREAGVHVETIRYYERLGLIAQPRSASGYRVYPDETLRRLQFIRNARKLGFSLKEVAEIAGMANTGVTCEEMCGRFDQKLRDMDRKIQQLTQLRDELAGLVKASRRKGPYAGCEVYKSLALS